MNYRLRHEAGRSRAVVMGTWKYSDPALGPYLPAVENSWTRFIEMLTGPLCGWPKESVTRVANESDAGSLPSLLMEKFEEAEDLALFYYVGHGLLSADEDAELCLGLAKTVSDPSNRVVPTSLLFSTTVRRALLNSKAKSKIVILDCCYSGSVLGPVLAPPRTRGLEDVPVEFMDSAEVAGSYVLVAGSRNKRAYYESGSRTGFPETYFSKYLVDLVESGIEDGPALLTIEALFNRLKTSLPAAGHPRPDRRNIQFGAAYPFCHNAVATVPGQPTAVPDKDPVHIVGLSLPSGGRPGYGIDSEAPRRRARTAPDRRGRPVNRKVIGAGISIAGVAAAAYLMVPNFLADPQAAAAPLSYAFQPISPGRHIAINRKWTVGGSSGTFFTEQLTVSNDSGATVHTSFAELIPMALRADMGKAHFTRSVPEITDADARLDWTMIVPGHGAVTYGFRVDLSARITQQQLTGWGASVSALPSAASSPNASASAASSQLKSLTIHPASPRLPAIGSIRLELTGLLADGKHAPPAKLAAAWHSSNPSVVTVSTNGTITAVAPGSARVTARVGAVSASVTVTVASPVSATPTTEYSYQPTPAQQQSTPAENPTTTAPTSPPPSSPTPVPTITASSL